MSGGREICYHELMFNIGDIVGISDDFEGSVVLHGWTGADIVAKTFEVVSFADYYRTHPDFALLVQTSPSHQGEVFLKHGSEVFVLSPAKALELVKKADPICNCPINRLWAGRGHAKACPEFPS
jgi:hypothetical protein